MTLRARRRSILGALFVTFLIIGGLAPVSTPAAPNSLDLVGHGWGHGRGMGQYGALGYALDHGWSTGTILGHFYGDTAPGTIGNNVITVQMKKRTGQSTIVVQERGRLFTSPGDGRLHTAIRIDRVGANTFQLYDGPGCGGPWTPRGGVVNGPVVVSPSVQNDDRTEMLQQCEANGVRWLRGTISAVDAGGQQWSVNTLPIESYLRGVVPREMPASWADLGGGKGMQALQAQAVAARSYAWSENRSPHAKTCDDTACQVYGGRAEQISGTYRDLEDGRSNAAIANTGGQVRVRGGAVMRTEFSSSTGGYTAGGTFPAVPDDGDDVSLNPNHTWTASIPRSAIEAKYAKGTFLSASVLSRNGLGEDGGRVLTMRLRFTGGDVDLSGASFQASFGLKSNWFRITTPTLKFSAWEPHGGALTSAPAAAAWGPGRLDTFARGPQGNLIHRWYDGRWNEWENLGGDFVGAPAVAAWAPGRIDVFVRGTDNALWHKWFDGRWSGWESLGGILTAAPAVSTWGPGRLDVWARSTDRGLWHRWFDHSWSPWESLGGVLEEGPAATSWGVGRVDVFATTPDDALSHKWFENGWSGWESLGGVVTAQPAVTSWGKGRLDVVVRGGDNAAHHRSFEGGWSPFEWLGGTLRSAPGAASWAPGRLDMFMRGTDGGMWHKWGSL